VSPAARARRPVVDFGDGRANVAAFPRAAWLRSVRRVLVEASDERLGYLDGRGAVEASISPRRLLNRGPGTHADADADADAESIVITNGHAQAISLLIDVLATRGATSIAVEDPSSSDDARPRTEKHEMTIIGVLVFDEGVRVDAVSGLRADALILTPSHQWPTGGVLSPEALSDHLPQLTPAGIVAGLHLVAWLPETLDETAVIAAAATAGVAIAGGSPLRSLRCDRDAMGTLTS
jgi:GntR family transcriptional regulator / MocR family aminotransferase